MRSWYSNLDASGRQRFWVAVILAIALLALLLFLKNADSPDEGLAARITKDIEEGSRWKFPPPAYFKQIHLWKAAVINAWLIAALLLTSGFWLRWAHVPRIDQSPKVGQPITRISILFLLGAIVIGMWMRVPLMDRHILRDEQDNLRRNIHGYTDLLEDGTRKWKEATWDSTFHENRLANNPIFFSVLAHGSLGIWRTFSGAPRDQFNLVALRMPSLLAGLASIILIWRLLHWINFRWAASFAAFLMAMHPMTIDFDVQARGYSLCMLFVLSSTASAYLALRTLRWRWWIAYGASIMLCLYSYPGSIYFAVGFNAFLGAWLLLRSIARKTSSTARPQLVRMGIANLLAAIIFLQLAKPAIAQAQDYLAVKFAKSDLNADWIFTVWGSNVSGVILPTAGEWWNRSAEEKDIVAYILNDYIPGDPLLAFIVIVLAPLLLGIGILRICRGDRNAVPMILGGLAAPVLAYAHSTLITGLYMWYWYSIYFLPIFIIVFSVGITSIAGFIRNRVTQSWVTLGGGIAYLIAFAMITSVSAGKGRGLNNHYGPGKPYVEFQRGKSRWRVYPNGTMTRELDKKVDPDKPITR
ncbi:MAG: hypothetical protein GY899_13185 [Verrucomicrobiaceae bacterium]|nr:hypothetical protein [Verrucomicrobiaceae bacterium]